MTSINANTPNAMSSLATPKSQMSQEGFMKMLLTQLKMQNPLNPFDASTMMQQIAQLTGLSATQQLADSMDKFKSNLGTSQVLEASKIVGKNVQIATDKLQLLDAQEAKGAVLVPQGMDAIEVAICDSQGKQVRTLKLNAPSEGVLDFSWDGKDDSGKSMEAGFYTVSAKGIVAGEETKIPTVSTFKVNSVALDRANSTVILNVDGLGGVSMNDVVKIL